MNNDLLLLHGTIYGKINSSVDTYIPTVSPTIFKRESVSDWIDDLYSPNIITQVLSGEKTTQIPYLDFIHWDTGTGYVPVSGFDWWRQCTTLFMRHI